MIDDAIAHLSLLTSETKATFGRMTPQHMVEHLIWTLKISNGEQESEQHFRSEKAEKMKNILIYTDAEIPVGFKSPVLPEDDVLPLEYSNLHEAKSIFAEELNRLHNYFDKNPEATPINPSLGALSHKEWLVFHTKHFRHHFKQFNLIQ